MKKFINKILSSFLIIFAMTLCLLKAEAQLFPTIEYQVYLQNIGWTQSVTIGKVAGTTDQFRRMEAIKINFKYYGDSMISYRAHVQDIGWQGWKQSGEIAGTVGHNKRMEAIEIKLNDLYAQYYDISYRVYATGLGWLNWAQNGEAAGTTGQSRPIEAIQIRLIKRR